jgi:hypothetical protein
MEASGYLAEATPPSELEFQAYIQKHPELIDEWYRFSGDQRCVPAWVLDKPADTKSPFWAVGRYPDIRATTYPDGVQACAAFVGGTVRDIAELIRRHEERRPKTKRSKAVSSDPTDSRIQTESPTVRFIVDKS